MYSSSALLVLGSLLWAMALAGVVIWILTIIAYWKMFTKAGEKGWKAIIPVYSTYKIYDITWKGSMFWLSLAAGIVSSILVNIWPDSVVSLIIATIVLVFALVISVMACFKMSKAYGHGVGYGFGLLFLNTIFILILGFGKSEYVGKQD